LVVVSSKTQMWLLYCFEICTSTFYSIFIIGLTVLSLNNFPDTYCTMFYPIPKMKMPLWNLRDLPLFAWLFASLVWVCVVVFHNFWQHYQFFLLDFPKMKFFFFLLGRIYLGMHSGIDIIAGLAVGFVILSFWLSVHDYVDSFVVSGQNGM
jgi:hypothetical protein